MGTEPDQFAHGMAGNPLDPERAYVGAVLHSSATDAAALIGLLQSDDLASHRLRAVLAFAGQLAAENIAPDPVAVLAHARKTGEVVSADSTANLSVELMDLYAGCPMPASGRYYAVSALGEALRRRAAEAATRIAQAAGSASLDAVVELTASEAQAVAAMSARLDALNTGGHVVGIHLARVA